MSEFIDRQGPIIERTGLGLLPGIALALFISLALIAAIMFETWLALTIALVGIFAVTGVVMAIILGLLGDEDSIYGAE